MANYDFRENTTRGTRTGFDVNNNTIARRARFAVTRSSGPRNVSAGTRLRVFLLLLLLSYWFRTVTPYRNGHVKQRLRANTHSLHNMIASCRNTNRNLNTRAKSVRLWILNEIANPKRSVLIRTVGDVCTIRSVSM